MSCNDRTMSIVCTIIMGILTVLLCIVIADGVFGLNQPPAGDHIGNIVYWISIIALPLLFYKYVPWRYTFLNLLLYFVLYLLVRRLCPHRLFSLFLGTGGFISIPDWCVAAVVAVQFWGRQSIVYLIANAIPDLFW